MIAFRARFEALVRAQRRLELQVAVLRATWMGLAATLAAGALWSAVGNETDLRILAVVFGSVFAVTLAKACRGQRPDVARALDRRYSLGDLLITAVEVDRRGAADAMARRVLADACLAVSSVSAVQNPLGVAARREREAVLGFALLLAGLFLLGPMRDPLGSVDRLAPLGLVTGQGGEGGTQTGGGHGVRPGGAGAGDATLDDLATRLSDHAATRGVAEALAQGDAGAAARETRALAGRAGELSSTGRAELADGLRTAGQALTPSDPELAKALGDAGSDLADPNRDAAQSLGALANALDAKGGAPSQAARPAETRMRAAAVAATAVDSAPLATGQGGRPAAASGPAGQPGTASKESSPSTAAGRAAPRPAETGSGADALSVPWEWRSAVRRYFARTQ